MILLPSLSLIHNSFIPESCKIYPFVNIYDSKLGENVKVHNFVELGGCVIGDRTKISSHAYVCPFVEIGSDCFISHHVAFCNDPLSSPIEYANISEMEEGWKASRVRVGNCVRIGTHAVIMAGVQIGDHAIIGAGAVVNKNVAPRSIVAGVPARVLGETANEWEEAF